MIGTCSGPACPDPDANDSGPLCSKRILALLPFPFKFLLDRRSIGEVKSTELIIDVHHNDENAVFQVSRRRAQAAACIDLDFLTVRSREHWQS